MRKLLKGIVICAVSLATVVGIVGCDSEPSKDEHNMTYHAAVAATCTEEGNIAYYSCDHCNKNFADEDGTTEITESVILPALGHDLSVVAAKAATCTEAGWAEYEVCSRCDYTTKTEIASLGHDWATDWSRDANGHWHACQHDGCTEKTDEAAHTPDRDAPTETEPVVCTVCGYVMQAALGHTHELTLVPAVPSTCTQGGHEAYYTCSGCSKWFADAEGTQLIEDHSCVNLAPLGHDWATVWSRDANGHWHACQRDGCAAKTDESAHTPDRAAPTETEPVVCTVCGYEIQAALGHTLTLVPAVSPTCTQGGHEAYYTCSGCSDWFEDAEGTQLIEDHSGVDIDPLGHDWATVWSHDENAHWHACQRDGCAAKTDEAAHSFAPATTESPERCECGETRGEKLFYANAKDEFSTSSNPNGAWTYGSAVYAWDGSQTIVNDNGTDCFTFTASTSLNGGGDAWVADGVELKSDWLNADKTAAIKYTFAEGGKYQFSMSVQCTQEQGAISVRYVVIGADGDVKTWVFCSQNDVETIAATLEAESGDTLYLMFFNEAHGEGEAYYPQANYSISLTEIRDTAAQE